MVKHKVLRFSRSEERQQFFKTLNSRIQVYFKEKGIKKTGNFSLYLKSVIMLSLFLGPYFLIITLNLNIWLMLLLTIIIGIGKAGVGMNIMHDGNHGSFSSKEWINKLMGGTLYILSGNVYNWQVQHNVLHHTFTNIHGHDEDLESGVLMRFSKYTKWLHLHRFQHYYSLFFYGFLTLKWALVTDFLRAKKYLRRRLSYGKLPSRSSVWITLIVTKILYFSIWIVIPILVLNLFWWQVVIGFLIIHYVAGFILAITFQLAHIIENAVVIKPHESGDIEESWAAHQLRTTANFSTNHMLVNWFTGGLNHQIEHHLFPHISHVHYRKISSIVRKTAFEFNLPYYEYKSTWQAIISHVRHLKVLSKQTA